MEHSVKADAAFCFAVGGRTTCLGLQCGRRGRCIAIKRNDVSTLVIADQLRKNRYYVSSLIDVVGFLVENQLPLRGKIDAFDDMSEGGSGLFLPMLYSTIQKDPELANVVKTIPGMPLTPVMICKMN